MPIYGDSSNGGLLDSITPRESYQPPPEWGIRLWQVACTAEFRRKHRVARGQYFAFLASAGVGSGKTLLSGLIAAYLLNKGTIDRIIFVCPNRSIRRRVAEEFRTLNIHLIRWNKERHGGGNFDHHQGVILTYQALTRDHTLFARFCDARTLVIFDEIHHLGDDLSWSNAAESAFQGHVACVLGLSGTPYRGDNRKIPFVEYEDNLEDGLRVFKPDYTYTLGESVRDAVCKKPVFHWLYGETKVAIPGPERQKIVIDFDVEATLPMMNRRLNGAVMHGATSRRLAIDKVLTFCRRTHRKLIIFLGGDSNRKDSGGVRDATEFLPAELRAMGIRPGEMCTVVGEDREAPEKIREFGKSGAWILIAVNMISEGVDIPELSVALFLTRITARSTTIQRIGRTLRGQGEAHIFMFADPRYMEIAKEIEIQINHEIELGKAPPSAAVAGLGGGQRLEGDPVAIGLDCYEGGITVGCKHYSAAVRRKYHEVLAEHGFPLGEAFMSVLFPLIEAGKFGPYGDEPKGAAAP